MANFIAAIYWKRIRAIDRMGEDTIEELTAKADAVDRLKAQFARLPAKLRTAVGSTRQSNFN